MATKIQLNRPAYRRLRGYAFDPITSLNLDTADINQIIYKIRWEDDLKPGPEGEYIKVIDRDPASDAIYKPVNLNDPAILASDGLEPSETNPQFHQQMVYAVIMTTIKNFEKALGRKVMWSPMQTYDKNNKMIFEFVPKLMVYPHAVRDQNAYYSPDRKALLFGYYNATPADTSSFLPGGIVYSCLSHDIVAHETTHALLDGMYSRFMEITHPDVAGFHEGFSDIVALLQHFTYPEIVENQIRQVKGNLETENMLGKLAVEFGQSIGEFHSLRDAIGRTENGIWIPQIPTTMDYENNLECHERGALLVSAVFDAFIAIYKRRTVDLVRLATGGTGIVPPGEIHPDLVTRLANEASKVASHLTNMCVRALDYCPPVDLNYGDYLRALITADKELVSDDPYYYRIAFINAFRKRGIFPDGVPNLSVDTLCYNKEENKDDKNHVQEKIALFLRAYKEKLAYVPDRKDIFDATRDFIIGDKAKDIVGLHDYIFNSEGAAANAILFENLTGLVFSEQYKDFGIRPSKTYKKSPSIQIHSLRIHNRTGPDGNLQNQIIMTLMQQCKVAVTRDQNGDEVFSKFRYGNKTDEAGESMIFRGGCTLIFDLDDLTLRHAIRKPIFDMRHLSNNKNRKLKYNEKRMLMQYRCQNGDLTDKLGFAAGMHDPSEPFAFIHRKNTPIL
jgi:hypothetical protein